MNKYILAVATLTSAFWWNVYPIAPLYTERENCGRSDCQFRLGFLVHSGQDKPAQYVKGTAGQQGLEKTVKSMPR